MSPDAFVLQGGPDWSTAFGTLEELRECLRAEPTTEFMRGYWLHEGRVMGPLDLHKVWRG